MPDASTRRSAIGLLWVDGDPEYRRLVDATLAGIDDVAVTTAGDEATARDHLGDADCVVSSLSLPTGSGLGLLETVRDRYPTRPFVLHTKTPLADVETPVLAGENTDYVHKDGDASAIRLVVDRARAAVDRSESRKAADRLTVAVDASRDPILVADPEDEIAYANGQLTSAVGPARTDLCGRAWMDLFTDDSVAQLQHDAVPVGTDGWTWSGRATLAAGPGEPVTARTTLVQLEDGSKVFAFRDLDQPA
jgi:PAS domain-containing protein